MISFLLEYTAVYKLILDSGFWREAYYIAASGLSKPIKMSKLAHAMGEQTGGGAVAAGPSLLRV